MTYLVFAQCQVLGDVKVGVRIRVACAEDVI